MAATTISDFTVISLTGSDNTITFRDSFPGGAILVGKYGNTGYVHIRAESGCTSSNAPAIPNQSLEASYSDYLSLPASSTQRNKTWYLTVSTGTQSLVIIPA